MPARAAEREERSVIALPDHRRCVIVSSLFRGRLCQELMKPLGRRFERDEIIYRVADRADSIREVPENIRRFGAGLTPSGVGRFAAG